jgi:hypothetical protein
MLNKIKELNNMEDITNSDKRFCLSTIRLMYVWVFGCDIDSGKPYQDSLMEIKKSLSNTQMYDMKAQADKIVNAGFEAFADAIEEGVE